MNDFQSADFLLTFPRVLKKDKNLLILGRLAAEELHITALETKKNILYASIEEMPEKCLDLLAYDLHVDWYDYDYTVETKRKIIKNSVKVHQNMGTKYAVETVLRDIYSTAEIEEWFEYGGEPYTFRITVGIGNKGLDENTSKKIENSMRFYKNERSHCSGIHYSLESGRAGIYAAGLPKMGSSLKIKPYLQKNINAGIKEIAAAGIKTLNTFKVKAMERRIT